MTDPSWNPGLPASDARLAAIEGAAAGFAAVATPWVVVYATTYATDRLKHGQAVLFVVAAAAILAHVVRASTGRRAAKRARADATERRLDRDSAQWRAVATASTIALAFIFAAIMAPSAGVESFLPAILVAIYGAGTAVGLPRRLPIAVATDFGETLSPLTVSMRRLFGVFLPTVTSLISLAAVLFGSRVSVLAPVFFALFAVHNAFALSPSARRRRQRGAAALGAAMAGFGASLVLGVVCAGSVVMSVLAGGLDRMIGAWAATIAAAWMAVVGSAVVARNVAREAALRHERATGRRVLLLPFAACGWSVSVIGLAVYRAITATDADEASSNAAAVVGLHLLTIPLVLPLALIGRRRVAPRGGSDESAVVPSTRPNAA
jgi:hypothetical protein